MTDASRTLTRTGPTRVHAYDIAITPPLFGIAFGFAGLSGTWRVTGRSGATVVADLLVAISAALVVLLAIGWSRQLAHRKADLGAQLRDPALGPFVPVVAITPMLLAAPYLPYPAPWDVLGRGLVALFAVLTLAGGVAVVTAWLAGRLPLRRYHPGFYLPTAGGALLTAQCVTYLGWIGLAQTLFFVGVAAWLVLGVVTSVRLARTPLPPALRPVLAIEVAAPALAGNTYLVVFGRYDGYALAFAGVTAAMGAVQLGLIPYYRRAPFGVGSWAAAFSYATTATLALRWLDHEQPTGTWVWPGVILALATAVVAYLSAATGVAIHRGQFFTRRVADSPIAHHGHA